MFFSPGSDNLWQIQRIVLSSRTNMSTESMRPHLPACAQRSGWSSFWMIDHDSSYPSVSEWNVACWETYFVPTAAHPQLSFKMGAHKKLNTRIKWSLGLMEWGRGGKTTACKVRQICIWIPEITFKVEFFTQKMITVERWRSCSKTSCKLV